MCWFYSIFYLGCIYYCIIVVQPCYCILILCCIKYCFICCFSCYSLDFWCPSRKCICIFCCRCFTSTCMSWLYSIFYLCCIYYCIIIVQPCYCILSWCLSINSHINCISCSWKYFRSPSYKCISSWNCLIIWSTCVYWHLLMVYIYWIYNFFSISIIIDPCNCMWSIYTFIFIIISCIIIFTWNECTYWRCPWCSIPYCISCSCISSMSIFIYWICTIYYLSRNTYISIFCIWMISIFTCISTFICIINPWFH